MKKNTIFILIVSAVLMVAAFSLVKAATKSQLPLDVLKTGGVYRVVYTGTMPSEIPSVPSADDKVVDIEVMGPDQEMIKAHDYYKKITIPNIDTNDMPQISLYLKDNSGKYAALGNDVWQLAVGNIFVDNGVVYLRYGDDVFGSRVFSEMMGKDYKIVVIY